MARILLVVLAAIAAAAGNVADAAEARAMELVTAGPAAAAGSPTLPDFDGDGYADLAIGVPYEDVGAIRDAGAVQIRYGGPDGLPMGVAAQTVNQDSPGIRGTAEADDLFGWSVAPGDFDGDGYTDLAVGVRREDEAALNEGAVTVLYGSVDGLAAARNRTWTQDTPGVPDLAEAGDQFGETILAADFDADGFADLAVGVYGEDAVVDDTVAVDAGVVTIMRGSAVGLQTAGVRRWSQARLDLTEAVEDGDQFGRALAAGDFDGDGYADLAIGTPYEDTLHLRTGLVHVLFGTPKGIRSTGAQLWSQDAPGILGEAELRDQFGQSLAAGDLDGDGYADLAVGAWFEDGCRICNEGAVHVIRGSSDGLTAVGDQLWTQDSAGIDDEADGGDQFGQTLATGDFDGDGADDLAIGVPWEDFAEDDIHQDLGIVHVLRGSSAGATAMGSTIWHQDRNGVLDAAARDDHFGESLGAADFDADGFSDLVIGVPWEELATTNDGAVHVFRGSALGLSVTGQRLFAHAEPGATPQAGARLGWSVTSSAPRSGTPRTCYGTRGGPC
jgi:hypothetical protein